jgi:Acetyltransferase (GNAT) domain
MVEPGLILRPLSRADFAMVVGWLARPHVAAWWGAPLDLAGVEQEYGPCVDGTDPTEVFICSEGPMPIGLIQIYRLADNAAYERAVGVDKAAGVDLFVADATRLGALPRSDQRHGGPERAQRPLPPSLREGRVPCRRPGHGPR